MTIFVQQHVLGKRTKTTTQQRLRVKVYENNKEGLSICYI